MSLTPAIISVIALVVVIILSMTTGINVGLVAIASAWLIGTLVAGLTPNEIMGAFPSTLFLTLVGISVLFAIAETNGTLERMAQSIVRLARGDARWLPLIFFVIACALSAMGPGAIASVALVAPIGMAISGRAGVPHFLTALVVTNGANAGNLSPVSAVGIIANDRMAAAGLVGHEGVVWLSNFVISALVALAAYVFLKGYRVSGEVEREPEIAEPLTTAQKITMLVIAVWIVGVLLFELHPGLSAFAAAVVLVVAKLGSESAALKRVPWGVIVMVCGMAVLVGLLEATDGMDLFTSLLGAIATPATVNGVMAMVTGAISFYSSTSGVVLPAFLPTVPGVVESVGGGDPLAVALSVNIGSHLVDVSPLSTLGALCVAAVPDGPDARALFRRLLLWGVSMIVVGAVLCQIFAGVFAG